MNLIPVSEDLLKELTAPQEQYESSQVGPLRFFDREMRCASRGCRAPTYMKVSGVQFCTMHALRRLNEMIVEMEKNGDSG